RYFGRAEQSAGTLLHAVSKYPFATVSKEVRIAPLCSDRKQTNEGMNAIVITAHGGIEGLALADRPKPVPFDNEVLIRVHAAGINRPDIFQRKGHYPAPAGVVPDIPGLEVAGVVEVCGSEVTQWKPGDRVCALLPGGGYAEYASAVATHCLPIPDHLSFAEAAGLPEALFAVWH